MSSCSVHIRSISGAAELKLLDRDMRAVATGYGELKAADLIPGLYLLEIDAGAAHEERILSLRPGQEYEDLALDLPFPSAVPMGGTSTTHEYHAYPAQELSRQSPASFVSSSSGNARLVIFARNVGAQKARDEPIEFEALSLIDQNLDPVSGPDLGAICTRSEADGWVGTSLDLPPGGYALECREPDGSRLPVRASSVQSPVQQSLLLSEGWTTLVFLPCLPRRRVPSLELGSILMTRLELGFEPYGGEFQRMNLATEMAANGLRSGKRMVSDEQLKRLLQGKFQNPMLGILGAHVLLQSERPNWKLFDIVLRNLERLLGKDHPDRVALHVMGKACRDDLSDSDVLPVEWPPMVALGYRGLVARDADEPGLIVADSMADHRSSRRFVGGLWSRWIAPSPRRRDAFRTGFSFGRGSQLPGSRAKFSKRRGEERVRGLIERTSSGRGRRARSDEVAAPEIEQVGSYIERMVEQSNRGQADLSQLDLQRLSKRVGLPVSTVSRAVEALSEDDG